MNVLCPRPVDDARAAAAGRRVAVARQMGDAVIVVTMWCFSSFKGVIGVGEKMDDGMSRMSL